MPAPHTLEEAPCQSASCLLGAIVSGFLTANLTSDMTVTGTHLLTLLVLSSALALLSWLWITRPRVAALLSAPFTAAGILTWALTPVFPALLLAVPTGCLLSWWLPRLQRTNAPRAARVSHRHPLTS